MLEIKLQQFGKIPGLRVNKFKTLQYFINIPDTLCTRQQLFVYKWVTSTLPYLGINIPLQLQDLLATNFTPMIT